MANRVIRDWTDSEKVNKLSLGAEVFFTRLFMKADDFGSFHATPKLIIGALFPLRMDKIKEAHIQKYIYECENAGLLFTYEVKNRTFLRINNFGQRLRNMRNTFPSPSADNPRQLAANGGESLPETKRNEVETEVETNSRKRLLNDWVKKAEVDEITIMGFCKNSGCEPEQFTEGLFHFFSTKQAGEKWTDEKDFKNHLINWGKTWKPKNGIKITRKQAKDE